jgi:acyl-CoA dehydrogenase-like protein
VTGLSFDLTDEQEQLRRAVRDFTERECPKDVARRLEAAKDFPEDLARRIAKAGLNGIGIPEEYGGQGGDLLDQTIVCEELSRTLGGLAWLWGINVWSGARAVLHHGNAAQKERYLPAVASGDLRFAFAMTTKASPADGGYVLRGTKIWSTTAHVADRIMVTARTSSQDPKPSRGLTIFLVDGKSPGLTATPIPKIGMRSLGSCEVVFDDVFVPAADVLGEVGQAPAADRGRTRRGRRDGGTAPDTPRVNRLNRVNRRAVRRRALRERAPVAGADGFRREEFGVASRAAPVIFFICPYGTAISTVRWAIRRLGRRGYHVVAYETTTAVFMDGDPEILPSLIAAVRTDIGLQIARLKSEGVTEFGFFGSSLGSFIFYNCVGDAVPELRWGVFNTGGDIAQGMWRLEGARQAYVQRGWSLPRLEEAWAGVQWPEFGRLDGCRFVFVSSRRDTIAPLANIPGYLGPMRRAGARVSVLEVPAIGHFTTIAAGLWRAPRFVALVRSGTASS